MVLVLNRMTMKLCASKLSAEAGNWVAQCELGVLYRDGNWIEQNLQEAVQYFRLAVDSGYRRAMVELGKMCKLGQGVEKDAA